MTTDGIDYSGEGVADIYTPGDYCSLGKAQFNNREAMWRFLKAHEGRKFEHGGIKLFHGIDKTVAERLLSKRTSRALTTMREHLVETGTMRADLGKPEQDRIIKADWDNGIIRYIDTHGQVFRIFEASRTDGFYGVGVGASQSGLGLRYAEKIAFINFG